MAFPVLLATRNYVEQPGAAIRKYLQADIAAVLEHTVDGRTTNPVSAEETVSKCRKTLELSEDRSGKDR